MQNGLAGQWPERCGFGDDGLEGLNDGGGSEGHGDASDGDDSVVAGGRTAAVEEGEGVWEGAERQGFQCGGFE